MLISFFKRINKTIIELNDRGKKWIGYDGLLNMESFALSTLFFIIFFNPVFSVGLSSIMALVKCLHDRKNGHIGEIHDLICAVIGIIFGCIIGISI